MWKLIRTMVINIIFVIVLYIVSYTNRDSNAIYEVYHLQKFFLNTRSSNYNFPMVCYLCLFSFVL